MSQARRPPTLIRNRTNHGTARNVLLRELRLGAPISRVDLSKRTGMSKPAVTRGVAALIEEGLVVEANLGDAGSQGGRRPRMLELRPTAAAGLGCMIKPGRLVGALGGFDGGIEERETLEFDPLGAPEGAIDAIVAVLQRMRRKNPEERPLSALGVSVPGLVDEEGRIITTPQMPRWRGVGLAKLLEDRLGMPVYLDNESRVQAIAEAWFGDAQQVRNFICLEVGTGISAGIVVNGELWRGAHSVAGEVGHMHYFPDGVRCLCGNSGCWETAVSTRRLVENVRISSASAADDGVADGQGLSVDQVLLAADAGDPIAMRELGMYADALATGVCDLILAYDPERIILHGESVRLGDRLVEMLLQRVSERFAPWVEYDAPITLTRLGPEAALAGAVSLALHAQWGFGDPTARAGGPLIQASANGDR